MASVFISSTSEDLGEYRDNAKEGALAAGVRPVMMEYFTASGARPPLEECMAKVSGCDVVVAIVAHRYGWKPKGKRGKSITWLECERAAGEGKEVLAFLVDEKCAWPKELKDSYRMAEALERGTDTPQLMAEVKDDIKRLGGFKEWLNGRAVRCAFSTPEELQRKVEGALRDWAGRQGGGAIVAAAERPADPSVYLAQLIEESAWIDIRGLQVGSGKAHRFPIEDLYIPLTMAGGPEKKKKGRRAEMAERKPVPLEEALGNPRLVVVGDPGSGKTTFLRHAALKYGRAKEPFPVFIRIAELAEHIRRQPAGAIQAESPEWLIHFLSAKSEEYNQGLSREFFAVRLKKGPAILLLEGLDEAPGAKERERMVRLLEGATRAYRECRFVVTTRPSSYAGTGVLAGFVTVQIEPLETAAIETFLERWCAALFPEGGAAAKKHLGELSEALRTLPEIRRMARNPVMLTALAVVHWNERRMPEQRADLYESIVTWLARSREKREGREPAERCLTLLQLLALAMQRDPRGRQVQVEKGQAAEVLASGFEAATEAEQRELALQFLEQEEVHSGIVVSRGAAVRFWHLTFQEYLAARAIAGMVEADQRKVLLDGGEIYRPEWREVALLLAGVLGVRQGLAKVEGLFSAVLDRLGGKADLAAKARCAGLLGAIVSDLKSLGYRPEDSRYRQLMDAVLGIFDRKMARSVEYSARLEAAEALGQAGDPRLGAHNWVRIGTFEIGKYPVTVAEYGLFMENDGYEDKGWWKAGGLGDASAPFEWEEQQAHPNWPVTGVNWYEASAYCAWRRVRLPTEQEWERAARGRKGKRYPWGDAKPNAARANYLETGPKRPTPVGLYPAGATAEGILDLAGNVWEWMGNRYGEGDDARVLRGGSWGDDEKALRAAVRFRFLPVGRHVNFGFRLAREVDIP